MRLVLPASADEKTTLQPEREASVSEAESAVREVIFHPRPPDEWQGAPVDVTAKPPCNATSDCQLALVCNAGVCGPCRSDGDCLGGEVCVLDRCLAAKQAECKSRRDCKPGELCIIRRTGSDALSDMRGNRFLESECTRDGFARDQPEVAARLGSERAPDPPRLKPASDVESLAHDFQSIEVSPTP